MIYVLLILAGISISMLSGDNGILQKATDAQTRTGESQIKEEIGLAWNGVQTEGIVNGWTLDQKAEALQTELKKEDSSATATASGNNVYVKKYKGYDATINTESGTFTKFAKSSAEKDEDTPKFELTIAGIVVNETIPPNPDSNVFEYKEGTIDTGYVIKDKTNGNEFVWVPVEKDQKMTLDIVKEEDITSIKLIDPLGEEINLNLPETIGKKYKNINIVPTINGVYRAIVTTSNESEEKSLVVRSLYAKDTFLDTAPKTREELIQYYSTDEGYQEAEQSMPPYMRGNKEGVYTRFGLNSDEEFAIWYVDGNRVYENQFPLKNYSDGTTTHFDSVNKNGGFYIARYEAGATTARSWRVANSNDTIDAIKTANGVPTSKANQMPYNHITQGQAKGLAESMYPNDTYSFICTLPTGAAYDRILGWLINTENNGLNLNKIAVDSSGWGNYRNVSFALSSSAQYSTDSGESYTPVDGNYTKLDSDILLTTGAAPTRNISNNILDLAGNVREYTTEVCNSNPVNRGGSFSNYGNLDAYVSGRLSPGSTVTANNVGFRPALFLDV